MKTFLTVFSLLISWHCDSWAVEEVNLISAYSSALNNTETVELQVNRTKQANENVTQARGLFYPSVSAIGNYLHQDRPSSTNAAVSSVTRPDQATVKVTAIQPIFNGLRDSSNLDLNKRRFNAQEKLSDQSRINLFGDVAQAYFNVLSTQQDLINLRLLLDITDKRVLDFRQQSKIGKYRKGDLLSSQAQTAIVRVQIEEVETGLSIVKDQFTFLTGLPKDHIIKNESYILPKTIDSLETLKGLVENRPDIESLKEQVKAAEENVGVARSGHYPSVDAIGNYYFLRTGILANSKWDAGLNLVFPLFQGGITQSQVREASLQVNENELLLSQARRNALLEIETFYKNLQKFTSQLSSYKDVLNITEQNYKEQQKDFRFGLITNLEVLQSINSFHEIRRLYDRLQFQAIAEYVRLHSAVGRKPEEILAKIKP